eukprot:jgi/Bigna1/85001/estExt_fgenesh1_pg.C_10568
MKKAFRGVSAGAHGRQRGMNRPYYDKGCTLLGGNRQVIRCKTCLRKAGKTKQTVEWNLKHHSDEKRKKKAIDNPEVNLEDYDVFRDYKVFKQRAVKLQTVKVKQRKHLNSQSDRTFVSKRGKFIQKRNFSHCDENQTRRAAAQLRRDSIRFFRGELKECAEAHGVNASTNWKKSFQKQKQKYFAAILHKLNKRDRLQRRAERNKENFYEMNHLFIFE